MDKMFVIRNEQMEMFSDEMIKSFKRRLNNHLRIKYPHEMILIDYKELELIIENGLKNAPQYGLNTEKDIAVYTEIMIEYKRIEKFNMDLPWIQKILNDKNISKYRKLKFIRDKCSEEFKFK